jgi:hypothetical protein
MYWQTTEDQDNIHASGQQSYFGLGLLPFSVRYGLHFQTKLKTSFLKNIQVFAFIGHLIQQTFE